MAHKRKRKTSRNVIDLLDILLARSDRAERDTAKSPPPFASPAGPPRPAPRPFLPAQIPADDFWVPAGHAVTVRGRDIPHGLVYVGSGLSRVNGSGPEPALLDPALLAEEPRYLYRSRESVRTYSLSYKEMTEDWRAGYLNWLAAGRGARQVNPGYPLLFFYGLERRALTDAPASEAAHADLPAIEDELRRLLSCYGGQQGHGMLEQHAGHLLDILRARRQECLYEVRAPVLPRHWQELPPLAHIVAAQLAADDKPLPAAWALAIVRSDANCPLRTSAERCRAEFDALFALRYAQAWPDGIPLKAVAATGPLTLFYVAANPSFSPPLGFMLASVPVDLSPLPAVSLSAARRAALREMAMACCAELDAYSRWRSRNAARKGHRDCLEGWALLPADLRQSEPHPRWASLSAQLESTLRESKLGGAAFADVPTDTLLRAWRGQAEGALSPTVARALLAFLAENGYGVEPDARFGRPALLPETQVVLFRQPAAPDFTVPDLAAAHMSRSAVVALAVALACMGKDFPEDEWDTLYALVDPWLGARGGEALRLRALLRWLLRAPAPPKVDKRTTARIAEADRADALGVLTRVVARLEPLLPARLARLETLYEEMGRAPGEASCAVYAAQEDALREHDGGPVTVRPALRVAAGFAVPPPPETRDAVDSALTLAVQAAKALMLDQAQVAARAHETAEVARVLGEIFAEEEDNTPFAGRDTLFMVKEEGATAAPGSILSDNSLSGPLRVFLGQLSQQPQWGRAEWEAVAARLDLMPDAAFDAVNEAAWDAFGEPVLEGEDPLCVQLSLAGELAL